MKGANDPRLLRTEAADPKKAQHHAQTQSSPDADATDASRPSALAMLFQSRGEQCGENVEGEQIRSQVRQSSMRRRMRLQRVRSHILAKIVCSESESVDETISHALLVLLWEGTMGP